MANTGKRAGSRAEQAGSCEACSHRSQAVVCDLAGADLAAFQKIRHTFHYQAHQTIFYEGHHCLGLYVLCAGRVKLTRSSARGQRQIVGLLDAGEVIEKHAFQEQVVHEVTCETLEPSEICLIEREPYLALARRDGELAVKLIRFLSHELGRNMEQVDTLAFKSARQRVAGVLADLGERFGRKTAGGLLIDLKLKREELAEMAGVTVETLIRQVGALRDQGLLSVDAKTLILRDVPTLDKIAHS